VVLLLLACVLACPQHCRAAGWADSRVVGPLVCRADFPLDGLESQLSELAQLQEDLVHTLAIPAGKGSVEIYLFHDKATYGRYLERYLPKVPYRRALYVKGRGPGRVFAYWSREFEVDLRHECTHAMLHAALPTVPLWLDEGLAVYFEVPAAQRSFDHPHLATVRRSAQWGAVPSIDALEKLTDVADMGRGEYRDCWAWVHFMLHGPADARRELTALLDDIERGNPPGALGPRLRKRFPDLPRRFTEHFEGWRNKCRGRPTSPGERPRGDGGGDVNVPLVAAHARELHACRQRAP
jgi:hypothetical protein